MVTLPPGVGCWAGNGGGVGPRLLSSVGLSVLRGGGALWRLLRGLWALRGVGWYTRQGWRRGGCMGILQRFRGVRWCWWCSPGVCGSWASAGRCDALRGWSWVLALSSFHGAVMGFYGVSCGRWWTFSRALVLGVGLALGRCSSAVVAFLGF